jgi:hypothetical protein
MTLQSTTAAQTTISHTQPPTTTAPTYECPRDIDYDIFIVLDSSSNVDLPTFNEVKRHLQNYCN